MTRLSDSTPDSVLRAKAAHLRHPQSAAVKRVIGLLLYPVPLVAAGTIGYRAIEGWPWFDCLYMTVITLTTVGFREVHPLSTQGQLFTMVLAMGGIFTLFFAVSTALAAIVSGEIQGILSNRRMVRQLEEMNNHVIVCGYGRMGRLVAQEISAQGLPVVVIDSSPDSKDAFHAPNGLLLHGDATSDELLLQAGVTRARALISVVGSDADNLYITMTARLLDDKLFIVVRAEDENSEKKMLRAGANRVVSPYVIGGLRVAHAVLRPNVVDFLELATRTEHLELNIEEAVISPGSPLMNTSLQDSRLRDEHGLIIVAIKKADGKMTFNPARDSLFVAGDTLIMLGRREDLDRVVSLAAGK